MNNGDKTQTQRSLREKVAFLNKAAEAAEIGLTKKSNKNQKHLALWPQQYDDAKTNTMTPLEAEEIINFFWDSYKDLSKTNKIVQSIKDLPFSPGRIKYAHFVYVENLILNMLFSKEIGDLLIESYADINRRFVEDFESLNAKWKQYRDNLKKRIYF